MEKTEISVEEALKWAVKNHNDGKLKEAEYVYRSILKKYPTNCDALHLLGLIYHQAGKNSEAIDYIKKALELNPNSAIYYGNMGMVYNKLGDEDKSASCFLRAIELNPLYRGAHLAHYNLGIYFEEKGDLEEAVKHYDNAIEIDNNFFDARWNRSHVLLLLGRFREGWEDYEHRFKKAESVDSRNFGKPQWNGCSLEGRRILVICEQGFGDDIQFIRYVSLIKQKGGYIILECKKELRKLFESIADIDEFIDKEGIAPKIEFDFYIHLMSLPRIFGTNLENIDGKSYLKANDALIRKFKHKINAEKFKVGIVWCGNRDQRNDKNRSAKLEDFKCLRDIKEIQLFSLQKGELITNLDNEICDLSRDMNDFVDTAAIIENLDLIISVDTSVAHLAGAMGKRVWTLLCFNSDWRWLLYRKDCPWYSNMKLFRQVEKGNWHLVFKEVQEELRTLLMKNPNLAS